MTADESMKSLEEALSEFPDGLHDALLDGFELDLANGCVTLSLRVCVGETDDSYAPASLSVFGVKAICVDSVRLPAGGAVWIDGDVGYGTRAHAEAFAFPVSEVLWVFIHATNSFIHIAGTRFVGRLLAGVAETTE